MNASASPLPPIRLTPRTVLAAWRGITRKQLWVTFMLGCALWLVHIGHGMGTTGGIVALPFQFGADQVKAFALLLAFVIADRVSGNDPDRRSIYVWAVVVGAAVGAPTAAAFRSGLWNLVARPAVSVTPPTGVIFFIALDLMLIGSAAVWVILDRRRASLARARMHSAELERIAAAKRTVESELQAMQARVEPQFLFNTLAQVRDLYRTDAARGQRMIDELIAYLRAAMPKMRDTSSTVGQELDLVRAYLAIVRLRLGERLAFEIDVPAEIAGARMPPMMLLPLVDHTIVHGIADSQANGTIRIRTAVLGDKLRLEIADSGVGFLPESEDEAIGGIRERLSALFQSDASLALHEREGNTTEAVLEIPIDEIDTTWRSDRLHLPRPLQRLPRTWTTQNKASPALGGRRLRVSLPKSLLLSELRDLHRPAPCPLRARDP